ncbi:hypothetical protein KRZ98_00495 [Sphingobium sp. AS12]|nr:hypothetical protein [Sphingobium sp. AS12]MBV2146770.1 hypothetical protein [Sphingobium sp. AS12]
MHNHSPKSPRPTLSLFDRKRPYHPGLTPGGTLSANQLKQIVADMVG